LIGSSCAPVLSGYLYTIDHNDITYADENIAFDVVHSKLIQLGKNNDFSVVKMHMIFDDNNHRVLGYIFELSPQGYIVVSANRDLPPVLAYSFTSSYQNNHTEPNVLVELLKTDLRMRFDTIAFLSQSVIKERNDEWALLLDNIQYSDDTRMFQQWPPEGTTTTGGWVETQWHQSAPYNDMCPISIVSGGQRSVAGCFAVAMAQIINYHMTTNNIMFDDSDDYYHNYYDKYWIDDAYLIYKFPSFPELNGYLDTVEYHYDHTMPLTNEDKAALTFACGVAAQQVYYPSGSGTFGVDQAYQAYLRFSFSTVALLDDDDPDLYERLSQNMKDGLPAHLAIVNDAWTAGHNLVVDGYNTDDFYHLNFGWGGAYDGWYLLPDELPYGLTVIEGVIVDIAPQYLCGDVNGDGMINISDVVYLINYGFFPDWPAPDPLCSGDVNGDEEVNISDIIYLINYLLVPGSPELVTSCCS
jgi:hypothetical protein